MQLLVVILNETEKLHEVVSGLTELGIPGGTVIESQGMGKILAKDIPIFAGFGHLLSGSRPFNYTILCVVDDDELVAEAVRMLRDVLSETALSSKGIAFTLPVGAIHGLSLENGTRSQ